MITQQQQQPRLDWMPNRLRTFRDKTADRAKVTRSDSPGDYGGLNPILLGLHLQRKHIYNGTVPPAVVAKRRAKNRAARKARRAHR